MTSHQMSAAGELSPSYPLPHPANIHMQEIRIRIIANSAGPHRKRRLIKLLEAPAGQRDINRLAFHMQAVCSHFGIRSPKHGVGFWRPVTRIHFKVTACLELLADLMYQVQNLRLYGMHFARPVIPQRIVDVGKSIRDIFPVRPIGGRFKTLAAIVTVEG